MEFCCEDCRDNSFSPSSLRCRDLLMEGGIIQFRELFKLLGVFFLGGSGGISPTKPLAAW
jgi:hypothetical protein